MKTIYIDISWFFICTGSTESTEPLCFSLHSGGSGNGAWVCPEEWVGSLCHTDQHTPSMGSWHHFWEHPYSGRSLAFPAAEICSAGSDPQAVLWLFLLCEAVFFTHLKGIIHLGKALQVLTICGQFLANLAVVWILLFEDHSDLKIWFRSQWPVLPCLDLPCVWGHTIHPSTLQDNACLQLLLPRALVLDESNFLHLE